jgi:hypothetical protein
MFACHLRTPTSLKSWSSARDALAAIPEHDTITQASVIQFRPATIRTRKSEMRSPEKFRQRARHLLEMAQNCNDAQIAYRLRVIAADYFAAARVGNKAPQRQQQVQSDKKPSR